MAQCHYGLRMNVTVLGQELLPEEEEQLAELVRAAKTRELEAWKTSDVFELGNNCSVLNQIAQARCVPTWKMADGQESVKERLVGKGYQVPDLRGGIVDASRCVSHRSSHLQVISLCALKKRKLRTLDAKDALLQVDGFTRDVFPQAQPE